MLTTLLCTAPNGPVISPVEGGTSSSFLSRIPPPPPPPSSSGACSSSSAPTAGPSSSSSPTTPTPARKLSLRRPSIRKRIQSLSRVSGASLDRATSTLSSAASASKSTFSFFRHTSSSPSSAGPSDTSTKQPSGSGSSHTRGASTSSFASGKSKKSSSSGSSSGSGRLNILNISAPSAFKHQFHLGANSRTSERAWDETRWRQVIEMRETDQDDTLVIDVVPPTASSAGVAFAELPRKSTSSERNAPASVSISHSRSASQPGVNASASSPNLLTIATSLSTSSTSSSSSTSPASESTSLPQDSANAPSDTTTTADKAKKQAKRASLVKRKPVPQLLPEEMEPLPTATSNPARTSIPVQTTFVLVPDLAPGKEQVPETAPAGRTSFEGRDDERASRELAQKETLAKLERAATVGRQGKIKDRDSDLKKESASTSPWSTSTLDATAAPQLAAMQLPLPLQNKTSNAPEHIYILHPAPAPKPPPRRHTLAHMQARALGRGLCDGPSLPSISVPAAPVAAVPEKREDAKEVKEKEKERKKRRPVPIVAPSPSPGIVGEHAETPVALESVIATPILPPGLTNATETNEAVEAVKTEPVSEPDCTTDAKPDDEPIPQTQTNTTSALPTIVDNSPRPSLSSLSSDETARSASSSSSCDLELDLEPRTPTDERRVSAGSSTSIKRPAGPRERTVRIVVSGEDSDRDDDDGDERDGEDAPTPRTLRRVSKRPNPPVRREANEESVYVTADEAEDI